MKQTPLPVTIVPTDPALPPMTPQERFALDHLNADKPCMLLRSGIPYVRPNLTRAAGNGYHVLKPFTCERYGSALCVTVTGFRHGKNFGALRTVLLASLIPIVPEPTV
jgi:hypothetical protein